MLFFYLFPMQELVTAIILLYVVHVSCGICFAVMYYYRCSVLRFMYVIAFLCLWFVLCISVLFEIFLYIYSVYWIRSQSPQVSPSLPGGLKCTNTIFGDKWNRMATHGKISELDPTQESWDTYIEWLELYFVANSITEAEQKRAVLLTVSGPSTYKLIDIPQNPAEVAYSEIVKLVKAHHTLQSSVTVQRYKFHTWTQQPAESVAVFVAELQQLSEYCEFGMTLKDMIRDRLVCGVTTAASNVACWWSRV